MLLNSDRVKAPAAPPVLWRKARWTDGEPEVQRLLDLLPLLPPTQQQQVWQSWQVIWQTLVHSLDDPLLLGLCDAPTLPARRKLDALPFARVLLAQLAMASPSLRSHWVSTLMVTTNTVKMLEIAS
jgi:hypothetical protein